MNRPDRKIRKTQRLLILILALALMINGNFVLNAYAAEYKAAIGNVNYETLNQAVAAVAQGQTIRLLRPVEIGQNGETGIINRPGVTFFLDLGGQMITGAKADALLQVAAGHLTIYNGQLSNQLESGMTISSGKMPDASVSYPIGYQAPAPLGNQQELPVAYLLNFPLPSNGTIHYGSPTGQQLPMAQGGLYAGGSVNHHFYFIPDMGYKVKTIAVNGVTQPVSGQLSITNLTQDQTISVSFTKIIFSIAPMVYAGDVEASQGVTLTPTSAKVEYGGNQTFQFSVNQGYRLKDVLVNNVSIGKVTVVRLDNVTTEQTVTILLEKTALFIMLDAGHYEFYNHSPVVPEYYEGNAMWTFHGYLHAELEQYPGIIVETTRPNNSKTIGSALGPWERGAMGAGYDLMLSLHSNACSTASVDHVVGIFTQDPRFIAVSKGLGAKLTATVSQMMGTSQSPRIYSKTQSDGQDWYGINRGATSVGTPSLILEHSFHTNLNATKWLSQDTNLKELAVAEAKTIAAYYGVSKDGTMTAPMTPAGFNAYGYSYNSNKIRWDMVQGASGYQIYRSTSESGTYTKVKTTSEYMWIDPSLTCGSIYYYKVRAYRTTTDGVKYSPCTEVNAARPIPAKPSLGAVSGLKKATLNWKAISGANGYQIYRTTGSGGVWTKVKTVTSGSATSWANISLTSGKTYTYKVRAYRTVSGAPVVSYFSEPKTVIIK